MSERVYSYPTDVTHVTMEPGEPSPETDITRPRGPLIHRCAWPGCASMPHSSDDRLSRCAHCRAVRYCRHEHQILDRARHKALCRKIRFARAKYLEEEEKIREDTDYFDAQVGQFWVVAEDMEVQEIEDYMVARFELAELLRVTGTLDGVSEALEHMTDLLRLGGGADQLGLYDVVPAMLMRLDRDDECYDCIAWSATFGKVSGHEDTKQAWSSETPRPPLDPLKTTLGTLLEEPWKFVNIVSISTVLLLKLKFLVDIQNLRAVRRIAPRLLLPVELQREIELAAIRSPVCKRLVNEPDIMLYRIEALLLNHINRLERAIFDKHMTLMRGLFEPAKVLGWRSNPFPVGKSESAGDDRELERTIHCTYAAWWETTGVLEMMKKSRECALAAAAAGETHELIGPVPFLTTIPPYRDRLDLDYPEFRRTLLFLHRATHDHSNLAELDKEWLHAFRDGKGEVKDWRQGIGERRGFFDGGEGSEDEDFQDEAEDVAMSDGEE